MIEKIATIQELVNYQDIEIFKRNNNNQMIMDDNEFGKFLTALKTFHSAYQTHSLHLSKITISTYDQKIKDSIEALIKKIDFKVTTLADLEETVKHYRNQEINSGKSNDIVTLEIQNLDSKKPLEMIEEAIESPSVKSSVPTSSIVASADLTVDHVAEWTDQSLEPYGLDEGKKKQAKEHIDKIKNNRTRVLYCNLELLKLKKILYPASTATPTPTPTPAPTPTPTVLKRKKKLEDEEILETPTGNEITLPDSKILLKKRIVNTFNLNGLNPDQLSLVNKYLELEYLEFENIHESVSNTVSLLIKCFLDLNITESLKFKTRLLENIKACVDDLETLSNLDASKIKNGKISFRLKGLLLRNDSLLNNNQAFELLGISQDKELIIVQDRDVFFDENELREDYIKITQLLINWAGDLEDSNIKTLNDFAFSIKNYDKNIYIKFQNNLNEIDATIRDLKNKKNQFLSENIAKKIDENILYLEQLKLKLISEFNTIVKPNLFSQRIIEDDVLLEKISNKLLLVCNRNAYLNAINPEERLFNKKSKKIFSEAFLSDQEAVERFKNSILEISLTAIKNKFKKFWQEIRIDFDSEQARNLVSFMSISSANLIQIAQNRSQTEKRTSIPVTTCPACHRIVELKYTKEIPDIFIAIFAPYITKDNNIQPITENFMKYQNGSAEIKYRFMETEYQKLTGSLNISKVMKSNLELTWPEINQLANSENPTEQVRGLLMRSDALRQVGATFIKSKKLTDIRFYCPAGVEKDIDTNTCAIAFEKPSGSRSYNLQPMWNGQDPQKVAANSRNSTLKSYNNSRFTPTGWNLPDLEEVARNKTKGGFKFSNVYFGCPCHIDQIDEKLLDKNRDIYNIYLRHNRIAFAITKDASSYQPPTDPSGNDKNLDSQTIAYLICGSNASISLVDRNPSSGTYIIKYLSDVWNSNKNNFKKLINFLLINGFDDLEMMQMVEDSLNTNLLSEASETSFKERDGRNKKFEEILLKMAAINKIPADIFDIVKNLTLVCPFGHKFTIAQSLKFGESHSAVRINTSTSTMKNSELFLSSGSLNLENFKKYLVPIDTLSKKRKYVDYEDWISINPSLRRFNLKKTRRDDLEKLSLLKIKINDIEYGFRDNVDVFTDLIWNPNGSRGHDNEFKIEIALSQMQETKNKDGERVSVIDNLSKGDIGASAVSKEDTAMSEWQRAVSRIFDPYSAREISIIDQMGLEEIDINRFPAIPGGSQRYEEIINVLASMNSLGRMLKSSFSIINNWISAISDEKFSGSFTRSIFREDIVKDLGSKIFNLYIKDAISIDIDLEIKNLNEIKLSIYNEISNIFIKFLLENTRIVNNLRKPGLKQEEVAYNIIHSTILEFLGSVEDVSRNENFKDIDFEVDPSLVKVKDLAPKILRDTRFILELRPTLRGGSIQRTLSQQLTLEQTLPMQSAREREKIYGRLILVAYCRYLAHAIYRTIITFFNESSALFIGYNPLNINFDSMDDILKISQSQIDEIKIDWRKSDLYKLESSIVKNESDYFTHGDSIIDGINKAYAYLKLYTENARSLAISPVSINEAKDYLVKNLSDRLEEEYMSLTKLGVGEVKAKIKELLKSIKDEIPVIFSTFENAVTSSPNIAKYSPNFIFPNLNVFQNSRTSFSPGSKSFENFHEFYETLVVSEEAGSPVLINEIYNFNSGKIQAGSFHRPTIKSWPYEDPNDLKAGLPLPIYSQTHYETSISEFSDFGVMSLLPIIEIPFIHDSGESKTYKIDVSFLLQRGNRKAHSERINNLLFELDQIKLLYNRRLEQLNIFEKTEYEATKNKINEEIRNINKVLKSNAPKKTEMLQKRRGELISELEALEKKKENLKNLRQSALELRNRQILAIQNELSEAPFAIDTEKSSYFINPVEFFGLAQDYSGQSVLQLTRDRKMTNSNVQTSAPPYFTFLDPINAYKLISNPEIHGHPYVTAGEISADPEMVKELYIKFIVDIYNLDYIAEIFYDTHKKSLIENGYTNSSLFRGRELLILTAEGRLLNYKPCKIENKSLKPGRWFDLAVKDSSLAVQILRGAVTTTNPDMFPTSDQIKNMINKGIQSQNIPFASRQLGITSRPPETKDYQTVADRAAQVIRFYIEKSTEKEAPEEEEENDLNDGILDLI